MLDKVGNWMGLTAGLDGCVNLRNESFGNGALNDEVYGSHHVGKTAARTEKPCPADRSGNYGILELSF
jgi:hypothetical protein